MTTKSKNILKIIVSSLIIVLIAGLGSVNSKEYYRTLALPLGAPPASVFPVAWGIIYTLIIIAACIIESQVKDGMYKKDALSYYYTQFIVNGIWPYLFFVFKIPLFAFVVLLILLALVVLTFIKFYNLKKIAGYMFVPYILWLLYAGYINLFVAILN